MCTTVGADSETIAASSPRRDFRAVAAFGGVASLAAVVIGAGVLIKPPAASAVPSFARQTGQPCTTCHTAFPELTPFGRRFKLGGYTMGGGLSFEHVWNTTPAWGIPYIASTLAPQFAPPGTMIEGSLAGKVVGTGAYTFWNDMLYLEMSAYQNLSAQTLRVLGEPGINDVSIGGAAPYWRAAFEFPYGDQSFEIGTFGMYANQLPGRVPGFGFDKIMDVGFDAQYQYIGDPHSVTVKLTHIHENQQFNSTFLQGNSSKLYNTLSSFKASVGYVYDHTYSLTAAYFDVYGSSDAGLFGTNSFANSPNGEGLIFDAAYLPFSNGGPSLWPWANARIGVSYTHYLKLFGGVNNFDGAFHNASDNNTVFVYSWIAF